MNIQSVIVLFALFLHTGYHGVNSILLDDQGRCEFSDEFAALCSSSSYKSVKPILAHIVELKNQLKVTAKENIDRVEEVKTLRQNLQYRPNRTKKIEDLQKTIDVLRETIHIQNQNIAKIIDINTNIINNQKTEAENINKIINNQQAQTENINKIITAQDKLKSEIKQLGIQLSTDKEQKRVNLNFEIEENCFYDNSIKVNQTENISICNHNSTCIQNVEIPGMHSFSVLCNGYIADGGWIVIQKRYDGSEQFNRGWHDYRNGFGNLKGEFFLGLEKLHQITKQKPHELYIEFGYFNGSFKFAKYNNFSIQNEDNSYMLEELTDFSGTEEDGMLLNFNQKFTTYDRDNDHSNDYNCALSFYGSWWYDSCNGPNLNGKYYRYEIKTSDSMSWDGFTSLKSVQMLIRPKLAY